MMKINYLLNKTSTIGYEPVPIIALTANALKEDEQRSLDAGCTGHLTKPIRKGMFLAAVQHFIRSPLV